jgi:hypothetical protein
MRVDAAPRAPQIERIPKEGSTRGFFEIEGWSSQEDAIAVWSRKWQHKDVRGQDTLFLHARRGDIDLISWGAGESEHEGPCPRKDDSPHADAYASSRSSHPAQVIEAATKLGYEICRLSTPKKVSLVHVLFIIESGSFTCKGSSEMTSSSAVECGDIAGRWRCDKLQVLDVGESSSFDQIR